MEYFLPNQKISAIHGEPKRVRFADRRLKNEDRGNADPVSSPQVSIDKELRANSNVLAVSDDTIMSSSSSQIANASPIANSELSTWSLVVLPLYHPAAALYNGGMRETLFEDFSRIPAILNKMKEYN
jgi:hypothetical protein